MRSFHRVLIPLAILAAGACSEDTGVGPTEPGVQTEPIYSLQLTLKEVEASSAEACDGRALFGGAALDGEFHYRVEVEHGTDVGVYESRDYGNVLGKFYRLSPGENLDFSDQTFEFNQLASGETVSVRLRSTEWDGPAKDRNLNDRTAVESFTTGVSLVGSNVLALAVGTQTCGLTLHYDYRMTVEQVPIG